MKDPKTNKSISTIISNQLCIGCGICQPSCPTNAIEIRLNRFKEIQPVVNAEQCTNCGICLNTCPMEPDYLAQKVNRAISQKEKFGLNNATSWVGFQTTKSKGYTQSASGGILSTLLIKLLELNEIDGVLHAKQLEGNNNSPYFQAHLSKTIAEIHENRSSFYAPINFSSALSSILSDDTLQSVAIVGTPCVISAIKRFYRLNTALKQKKILLFALVCGHNVNGQFADHLSNAIAGKNQSKRKLKFRDKEGISVASNFNNSVLFASGEKIAIDRFKSPFTVYWRTGAYALNGCNFCPDFWGEEADATFKDAWGISLIKKEGETAFAIKNPELIRLTKQLEQEGTIYLRQITNDKFATSQERTFYDKTDFIETRARHHQALKKNIDHKHRGLDFLILTIVYYIKQHIQIQSKKQFAKNRIYSPRVLKFLEFFIEYGEKFVLLKRRYNKKVKPTKEVIYTSGFGYRNIGDEAQLETNLQLWKKIAPEYKVTLLSPNPDYTRRIHGNFDILTASRNSFLGISGFDYLGLGDSRLFYPYYWLRKQIIWANAFMIKNLNRTIFIGPESSILLKRLKKADLLHIGGGGLFTGKTKSRLYDLSFLIRLAHYLNTNIILSGHNIGLWRNTQQKNALKKLKYAKIIGLRDNSGSIEALKKLRIYDQNKVIPLFDDALFCEGMPKAELEKHFSAHGINPNKKYIAINCYTTATTQDKVEEAIDEISAQLKPLSDEFEFIAISTHPVDEKINDYFRSKLPDTKILQHNDNTALVVSCFQHAHICITVRHHPIIFSMSGCVPTISFTFDDYYELKNFGALKLFGQGKQVFQYKKDTFKETFGPLLKRTLENRESISREIELHLNEFSKNKGYIIKKYIEDYG